MRECLQHVGPSHQFLDHGYAHVYSYNYTVQQILTLEKDSDHLWLSLLN